MKTLKTIIGLIILIYLACCANEEIDINQKELNNGTYKITVSTSTDTKVAINDNEVRWADNDKIYIAEIDVNDSPSNLKESVLKTVVEAQLEVAGLKHSP